MDRLTDALGRLGVLGLGAWYFWQASQLHAPSSSDPLGVRIYPMLVGGAVVMAGIWLVAHRLMRWHENLSWEIAEGDADVPGHPVSHRRVLATLGLLVGYVVAIPALGYPIATMALVALAQCLFGARSWRRVVSTSIVLTVVLYLIFVLLLSVPLPILPMGPVRVG